MSTLGTIRDNVRRNLGEVTPRFYTNAEINQYIGEAYKNYVLIMIDEGEGYFETTTFLNFTANVPTVSIASLNPAFFSVSQLWRMTATGQYPSFEKETRFTPVLNVFAAAGDAYRPTWKLQGLNIILEPTPQDTETGSVSSGLKLDYNYIPTFPSASSADSFSFDAQFPIIFEPLIELYATIAAMESKDGMGGVSDIATFRTRLEQLEKTFKDSLLRSEFPDRVQYSGTDYSNLQNWRYY